MLVSVSGFRPATHKMNPVMLAKASIHRAAGFACAYLAPRPTVDAGLRQHDWLFLGEVSQPVAAHEARA